MVDRMKEFLTRFDKDYKVAFAKQQGVSDNFDTEQELDDYLIQNINICPQYDHDRENTYFLHRANTYPRRCHTCNLTPLNN